MPERLIIKFESGGVDVVRIECADVHALAMVLGRINSHFALGGELKGLAKSLLNAQLQVPVDMQMQFVNMW